MNMTHPDILLAEKTGRNWLRDYCDKIYRMADERERENIESDRATEDRQEKGMFEE